MLIVERNAEGKITAIRLGEGRSDEEPASLLDPEVSDFLRIGGGNEAYAGMLCLTDHSLVRVLEDLIDLMIAKNIILFTELPPQAQKKLNERKQLRMKLDGADSLLVDDVV
ncbi:MAG: hypothetical protein LBU39_05660 [Desulfobulbaceae bacterium]|nr:hypothetical protein [Desulfobulbaceae bacterium]